MNGEWEWILVAYLVGTGILLMMGLTATMGTWKERRLGARMVLTFWAWPVWLIGGLAAGIRHLWREADWGDRP